MDTQLVDLALRLTEIGAYGLLVIFIVALSRRILVWSVEADRRYNDMVAAKDAHLATVIAEKDKRYDTMVESYQNRMEDLRINCRERLEDEKKETETWRESATRATVIMDRTVALLQELEKRSGYILEKDNGTTSKR